MTFNSRCVVKATGAPKGRQWIPALAMTGVLPQTVSTEGDDEHADYGFSHLRVLPASAESSTRPRVRRESLPSANLALSKEASSSRSSQPQRRARSVDRYEPSVVLSTPRVRSRSRGWRAPRKAERRLLSIEWVEPFVLEEPAANGISPALQRRVCSGWLHALVRGNALLKSCNANGIDENATCTDCHISALHRISTKIVSKLYKWKTKAHLTRLTSRVPKSVSSNVTGGALATMCAVLTDARTSGYDYFLFIAADRCKRTLSYIYIPDKSVGLRLKDAEVCVAIIQPIVGEPGLAVTFTEFPKESLRSSVKLDQLFQSDFLSDCLVLQLDASSRKHIDYFDFEDAKFFNEAKLQAKLMRYKEGWETHGLVVGGIRYRKPFTPAHRLKPSSTKQQV